MNATDFTKDFTKTASLEQLEAAVKSGQDTALKMYKAGKDTAQKMYKAGTDAWSKGYEKATEMAREQVERSWPQAVTKFDEAVALGKDNIEAAFAAQAIAQKGFETIADEFAAISKKAAETQLANVRALLGIKSVQDMVEVQSGFARSAFDSAVAGATKVAELTAKVANEAAEPIQSRVTKVKEKYSKPIAA